MQSQAACEPARFREVHDLANIEVHEEGHAGAKMTGDAT